MFEKVYEIDNESVSFIDLKNKLAQSDLDICVRTKG